MAMHAQLGASSMARWAITEGGCPGSVRLSEGLPDTETAAAREGSAAHALAEHCLLSGDDPFEWLDADHPVEEYQDIAIDVDMVDAVTVYVDYVRSICPKIRETMVERRVSLEKLGPWAEGMFGTADFVTYAEDGECQRYT